ncbi:MAG: thioredoxin domain-containing protein [Candidatus Hydrogenedentes bacterium]|nr:thioredoxin domain-containing protein [Candidatus Hydrogenedentota bacterium]
MTHDDAQPLYINHLIHETSPYLLQHAHNPVEWYPWGEAAFKKAREEDKPIFLSIGYAACHWCHVMEHESFENEEIAQFLAEYFVSIKVDREERPDLDDIYMTAVMGLTGHGGWPMTVFLTPDLHPFYGGTYYPPVDRHGHIGFPTLLRGIAQSWEEKREEILKGAENITNFLKEQSRKALPDETVLASKLVEKARQQLKNSFDAERGGWGGAPKFPNSGAIGLLLRSHRATGDPELLEIATATLDKMARGGMYDQIGGGFHRYSVDAEWLVPHFEKMLYDNGQLAQVYLEAWQATGDPYYRQITREILDYEIRDMLDSLGGFHSTEDADSEGEEGKFYLWTHREILDTLGEEDGRLICAYYNIMERGNFSSHETYHRGLNIPHISRPPARIAAEQGLDPEVLEARVAPLRQKLLEIRAVRTRPGLDDKVLTSWNALLITPLALAGAVLGEPRYTIAAENAGRFLMERMLRENGLLRTHRHGESRIPGYLDDYAFTTNAFVDLYEGTLDPVWIEHAAAIAEQMIARFGDEDGTSFYFTEAAHTDLILRTRPTYDGAEPSGNSVAALALLRLGLVTGREDFQSWGRKVVETAQPQANQAPQGYLRMLWAVDFLLHAPVEITLVGPRDDATIRAMHAAVFARYLPNRAIVLLDPDNPGPVESSPLAREKTLVDGQPAAYVCVNQTCLAPVRSPEALGALLDGLGAGDASEMAE